MNLVLYFIIKCGQGGGGWKTAKILRTSFTNGSSYKPKGIRVLLEYTICILNILVVLAQIHYRKRQYPFPWFRLRTSRPRPFPRYYLTLRSFDSRSLFFSSLSHSVWFVSQLWFPLPSSLVVCNWPWLLGTHFLVHSPLSYIMHSTPYPSRPSFSKWYWIEVLYEFHRFINTITILLDVRGALQSRLRGIISIKILNTSVAPCPFYLEKAAQ